MSKVNIDLNRLQISLHGVSAEVAEAAMNGLGAELRRRLGRLSFGDLSLSDRSELTLGDMQVNGHIDAADLRGLITDRLVTGLRGGVD